jgi:ubiquinol-cytochrome c reductase iron-sulfur subunit
MNSRTFFSHISVSLIAIAGFALAYVVMVSLKPTSTATSGDIGRFSIDDLKPGEIRRVVVRNIPVLLLQPSKSMLDTLNQLDQHVWNRRRPKPTSGPKDIYVYSAVGDSCTVLHVPRLERDPFDIQRKWLGGYVDPCRGSNYDYAGRAIRSTQYTTNAFSLESPSLFVPQYRIAGGVLEINMSRPRETKQ